MDVLHYSISASMGLGGYLSGKTEVDHYKTEKKREEYEVKHQEDDEVEETLEIFREYGLSDDQIAPICEHFKQNHDAWVDFMMKFELQLDKPDEMQPIYSALVIGGSYLLAGMIPLIPYLIIGDARTALKYSIIFTLCALFIFGILKVGQADPSSDHLLSKDRTPASSLTMRKLGNPSLT